MTLENAISEIGKFWSPNEPFPFGQAQNDNAVDRLTKEFAIAIPETVQEYVKNFAPQKDFYFDTVGNPMRVYGISHLKYRQDGYNYNPVKSEGIEGWEKELFIFADEGADPVVIDLTHVEDGIQKRKHGAGSWEYGETTADTLGQFLLCSAAQHHALNGFGGEPILDDGKHFILADKPAKWYLKNMKNWAGDYYEAWCSVFNNYQ